MIHRRALPVLLAIPALAPALAPAWAQAAPMRVLGTGATEQPVDAVAHEFTSTTGRLVRTQTGNGGQVAARLRTGDTPDVVLNAEPALQALAAAGFVRADSLRDVGRMWLAVAVRRDQATEDLSTEVGLGAFLRAAPSIGLSDAAAGATSGEHVLALLRRFEVTPEATGGPRRIAFARGITAVQAAARGEVFCVITQASEILAVPDARLVAPLPEPLQLITRYMAAIPTRAPDPQASAELIALATGPWGQRAFAQVGFRVG